MGIGFVIIFWAIIGSIVLTSYLLLSHLGKKSSRTLLVKKERESKFFKGSSPSRAALNFLTLKMESQWPGIAAGAAFAAPRGLLKGEACNHMGIASALATLMPMINPMTAIVRAPSQCQSGRMMSPGW